MTKAPDGAILITGASTGIGRAAALRLAKKGYRVLAGVRKETDAESLRHESAGKLSPVILDVTQAESISEVARSITPDDGLFALINNAGHNYMSPFESTDWTKARALLETNLFGLAALTQALLPHLRAAATQNRWARIINVSSIGGLIGVPWEPWYHASKFAVVGLSESLRHEVYAQNIAVSVVCPGGIRTPFIAKSGEEATRALDTLTTEHRTLYGKGLQRLDRLVDAVARSGSDPDLVARAMEALLRARRPPFLKIVGADAISMLALRTVLPRAAFLDLLRLIFTAAP